MRNRAGVVVGMTCRVGRAIEGGADMIRDLLVSGRSVLLLGRPGVGKTTAIREIARVLSDDCGRRVVVVDTSNEIGGDGDVPHPGIGGARRMQVAEPSEQHATLIEAVQNHTPQVVVVDEIGTEARAVLRFSVLCRAVRSSPRERPRPPPPLAFVPPDAPPFDSTSTPHDAARPASALVHQLECAAARTISQRGVQMIATAHGHTLENVLKNPSLNDLVGGVVSVTLGDDEARKRRAQKTTLEREGPPTFGAAVEARSHWSPYDRVRDVNADP
jgi:stage III sporulation protein SpoIIIAA